MPLLNALNFSTNALHIRGGLHDLIPIRPGIPSPAPGALCSLRQALTVNAARPYTRGSISAS